MSLSDSVNELVQAVRSGRIQKVQRLVLSDGVGVGLNDAWGFTALTIACLYSRVGMVRWLIEEGGADINVRRSLTPSGETPLHVVLSSKVDRDQKVRLLLKNNADANLTSRDGETPLQFFCRSCYEEDSIMVVRLLLEGGADVNLPSTFGRTPVFTACLYGHLSLLRLLVEEYGADINVKDEALSTPLMHMLQFCVLRISMVQYLLERGAEVTSSNINGRTTLHLCVLKRANTEIARLLLEHGASVTAMDKDGETALHIAVRRSNADVTRLLLKNGANTKLVNKDGKVPFVVACEKSCTSAIYLLLRYGVGDGSIRFLCHQGRKFHSCVGSKGDF